MDLSFKKDDFNKDILEGKKEGYKRIVDQIKPDLGTLHASILSELEAADDSVDLNLSDATNFLKTLVNKSFTEIKNEGASWVLAIQLILKTLQSSDKSSYYKGKIDAIYGNKIDAASGYKNSKTKAAIKEFQTERNIDNPDDKLRPIDGLAGKETIRRMLEKLGIKDIPKKTTKKKKLNQNTDKIKNNKENKDNKNKNKNEGKDKNKVSSAKLVDETKIVTKGSNDTQLDNQIDLEKNKKYSNINTLRKSILSENPDWDITKELSTDKVEYKNYLASLLVIEDNEKRINIIKKEMIRTDLMGKIDDIFDKLDEMEIAKNGIKSYIAVYDKETNELTIEFFSGGITSLGKYTFTKEEFLGNVEGNAQTKSVGQEIINEKIDEDIDKINTMLSKGKELYDNKEYDKALAEYVNILDIYPDNIEAKESSLLCNFYIGHKYITQETQDPSSAIKEFDKIIDYSKDNEFVDENLNTILIKAKYFKANSLYLLNKYDDAEVVVDELLKFDANRESFVLLKAYILIDRNNLDDSMDAFNIGKSHVTGYDAMMKIYDKLYYLKGGIPEIIKISILDDLVSMGNDAFSNNKFKNAKELFEKIKKMDPNYKEIDTKISKCNTSISIRIKEKMISKEISKFDYSALKLDPKWRELTGIDTNKVMHLNIMDYTEAGIYKISCGRRKLGSLIENNDGSYKLKLGRGSLTFDSKKDVMSVMNLISYIAISSPAEAGGKGNPFNLNKNNEIKFNPKGINRKVGVVEYDELKRISPIFKDEKAIEKLVFGLNRLYID